MNRLLGNRQSRKPPLRSLGEILLGDWAPAVFPFQCGPNFRQCIEPLQDRPAKLPVLKTAVQLGAEVHRKPSDFSRACDHGVRR